MKQIVYLSAYVVFVINAQTSHDFRDLLTIKEANPNPLYYQLLPETTDQDPSFVLLEVETCRIFLWKMSILQ